MIVKSVTVEIDKNRHTHFLRARVRQKNSGGQVYGRNLLSEEEYIRLKTAQFEVVRILGSKVGQIIWDIKV